jgi:hypothetical protein
VDRTERPEGRAGPARGQERTRTVGRTVSAGGDRNKAASCADDTETGRRGTLRVAAGEHQIRREAVEAVVAGRCCPRSLAETRPLGVVSYSPPSYLPAVPDRNLEWGANRC